MIRYTPTRYKRPARIAAKCPRTRDDELRVRGDRRRKRSRNLVHPSRSDADDPPTADPPNAEADAAPHEPDGRTGPDDRNPDSADASLPRCPRCDAVLADVYTLGPDAHTAAPCGCPLAPDEVKSL